MKFYEGKRVKIDVIGTEFLVFESEDCDVLLEELRVVGSLLNETKISEDAPGPISLLPEQVQVLAEAGMVILRRIKTFDGAKQDEPSTSKVAVDQEEEDLLRTKAVEIAKRKELKNRKRKVLGDNVAAKVLRLKKSDEKGIDEIEVDNTEVEKVLLQLKQRLGSKDEFMVTYYNSPDETYEELTIDDLPLPCDLEYRCKVTVFQDLWRKGFYLTSGEKFGCDYLAYEKKPGEEHSKFMVYCKRTEENILPMDILSLSRVANQVKKVVLLAVVSETSVAPSYVEMNWWKGDE
ncbi:unnamed protein product [Bursaphelenchus okinawaensis]|uniref:tRNA-intron lyase n=1 Tax=Bursaphelenchus okinawaensis TaxID=465554 RepID=A0A811LLQ7_9BILA|nr:unnamed protein product [Bursaphelenchus okinawaensis]CAG9125588.1 unnamed protein product [Bursaphelenchus okinawaensis]